MPLFELSFIYRDLCGATAKKAFNIKHFRRIRSSLKPPSKITKQPLTYKTRNAVYVMYLGFESLTLRQNEKQVARPAFCFGKTKRGIRTRREQTQSAEENSPVDCFCRRGQGAKRREGARACTEKIPNSPPRSAVVHDTMGYRTFLFFCRESPHWDNTKSIRDAKQDYIFC